MGVGRWAGRARHSVRAVSVRQKVLVATAAGRGLPALPMMIDKSDHLKYNPEMPSGINRILQTKT